MNAFFSTCIEKIIDEGIKLLVDLVNKSKRSKVNKIYTMFLNLFTCQ